MVFIDIHHSLRRQAMPIFVLLECDEHDPSDYKWTARCPALPSCFSEGRTREEAITNVRDVAEMYLRILGEEMALKDVEVLEVVA